MILALLPIELCLFYLLPHFVASLLFMWQVHLSVSQVSVSLSVDCQHVSERSARPLGNLPTDGFEMLGKFVNTRGPNSGSAPVIALFLYAQIKFIIAQIINKTTWITLHLSLQFALQSFEIICNTTWASDDTCCDLPQVVSLNLPMFKFG